MIMNYNLKFTIFFLLVCLFANFPLKAQNIYAPNSLEKIAELHFTSSQNEIKLLPDEVEKINPAWVRLDEKGTKLVNYEKMTPDLLISIQELNKKVSRLETFHKEESAAMNNWGWKYFLEIGCVVIVFSSIFLSKKRNPTSLQNENTN